MLREKGFFHYLLCPLHGPEFKKPQAQFLILKSRAQRLIIPETNPSLTRARKIQAQPTSTPLLSFSATRAPESEGRENPGDGVGSEAAHDAAADQVERHAQAMKGGTSRDAAAATQNLPPLRNVLFTFRSYVRLNQGDQIGRIFAYGWLFSLGSFFEKCKSNTNYWATFSTAQVIH
jgi:hypothetical protein